LTIGNNGGNGVFGGVLKDGTGTIALTKAGGGTLTVANATNSYTGGTTISAGTIRLGASAPTASATAHYALDGTGAVPTAAGAIDYTFDVKYETLGNVTLIHGDIGNGTAWLTTVADATVILSPGAWHMVTYSVSSTGYTIFVDGGQVTSGTYNGTPAFMKTGQ